MSQYFTPPGVLVPREDTASQIGQDFQNLYYANPEEIYSTLEILSQMEVLAKSECTQLNDHPWAMTEGSFLGIPAAGSVANPILGSEVMGDDPF